MAWRLGQRVPRDPHMSRWQHVAARASHFLLYVLILALPLSGWLFNSAANFPLEWFGLVHVPSLTHGLDPVWTQRFRDVVIELRHPDRTILIASHNLDELSRLADRVAIMDRGRLQRVVDVRASERDVAAELPYRLVVAQGEALVPAVFPAARLTAPGEYELRDLSLAAINAGLGRLLQGGAIVTAIHPLRSALEQQFRDAMAAERPT